MEKVSGNQSLSRLPVAKQLEKLDQAREVGEKFLDGRPYRQSECLDMMKMAVSAIMRDYVLLGKYALAIKEMSGHGEFEKIIQREFEEPGIMSIRTIYRAMQVAQFSIDHPSPKFSYFQELQQTKKLMLSAATDDDVDEAEGTIYGLSSEEIKAASLKNLKALITKQDLAIAGLKKSASEGETQISDLREKLKIARDAHRLLKDEEVEEALKKIKAQKDIIGLAAKLMADSEAKHWRDKPRVIQELSSFFMDAMGLLELEQARWLDKLRAAGISL